MTRLCVLLLSVLVCTNAYAGIALQGNSNDTAASTDGLLRYEFNKDPSEITGCPTCCMVAKGADTAAMQSLLQTPGFDKRKYLVQASPCLAVSKSPAVVQQIVDADAAQAALQAEHAAEQATNPLCNDNSLSSIETKINNFFATVTTVAQLRDATRQAIVFTARCLAAVKDQ